jgi:uncharacterized metal-binding protein YceD (DUF177 family)
MIKIFIQGLKDGEYDIDIESPVSEVPDMFEEFFGNIHVEGKLRKFAGRFTFIAEVECLAKLICDRSLTEFEENIETDIKLSFKADGYKTNDSVSETEEILFNPDDKYLDITNEIREILIISLPMKRVAPEYRKKDFSEIFPDYTVKKAEVGMIDDRWEALKKLRNN